MKGEQVPLYYDEAFKIMFANDEHLEVLTALLSKILDVDYQLLEGRVSLKPLKFQGREIGEKKCEKDVFVEVRHNGVHNVLLEVNISKKFYQATIDRNLYYTFQTVGHQLRENEDYKDIPYTILVNFNTVFTNKNYREPIEEFNIRDKHKMIITDRFKMLNINIAECYRLWYYNKCQEGFSVYEESLILYSALLYTSKKEEFIDIVESIRIKPEIIELMKGIVKVMNKDEGFVIKYKTWNSEQERINASIIREEREEAVLENKKEIALRCYKDNVPIETIMKYCGLTKEEVEKVISNSENE